MQVGADRPPDPDALVAGLTVVPEAGDDAAERLGARVEPRPAGVVLEAGDRPALSWDELGLEQDVADHPPLAGDGLVREEADAGHRVAVPARVAAAQQLVAATDGEQRRASGRRLLDPGPFATRSGAISACSRSWPPPM